MEDPKNYTKIIKSANHMKKQRTHKFFKEKPKQKRFLKDFSTQNRSKIIKTLNNCGNNT